MTLFSRQWGHTYMHSEPYIPSDGGRQGCVTVVFHSWLMGVWMIAAKHRHTFSPTQLEWLISFCVCEEGHYFDRFQCIHQNPMELLLSLLNWQAFVLCCCSHIVFHLRSHLFHSAEPYYYLYHCGAHIILIKWELNILPGAWPYSLIFTATFTF